MNLLFYLDFLIQQINVLLFYSPYYTLAIWLVNLDIGTGTLHPQSPSPQCIIGQKLGIKNYTPDNKILGLQV